MAITNLYIQSGGNDMNAGTSTANAADVTSTNGSWDITADTFIATAATPFSAVTTSDWVSIYVDGTTSGAVYVAQVVSVNSGGLSVTLSTTAKYGTKPSASATGRSAKVNGAWASELAPVTMSTSVIPAATKVNWKQATYTIVASRTIAWAGATTKPLWFSGYNTTPGDLDADTTNALSKPVLALNSTFQLTTSGTYQIWSSFSITGSISDWPWSFGGTNSYMVRCRVDNASSNSLAYALLLNANGVSCYYCWFRSPTTATSKGVIFFNAANISIIGCVAEGGGLAGFNVGSQSGVISTSIALNNTGSGILLSTGNAHIERNTIYNPTVDGIKWSGTPGGTTLNSIVSNLLSNCGGYGVNNASGTATGNIRRSCNDYFSCTSGSENGFGDWPSFFGQTDSSAVVTSSTDMTPQAGRNARNNGFPGVFEGGGALGSQINGAWDIGSVRHPDPTGGSGGQAVSIFGG